MNKKIIINESRGSQQWSRCITKTLSFSLMNILIFSSLQSHALGPSKPPGPEIPVQYRSGEYNPRGCQIMRGFLQAGAAKAGFALSAQCSDNGSVSLSGKGRPTSESWSFSTPLCVDANGNPFVDELRSMFANMQLNLTKSKVSYEIGGAAFCRPGLFNKIDFSWSTL